MADPGPQVRVGIGIFVFSSRNDSSFVLGKRKGSLGAGTWALPGGHLEFGESFAQCAVREIREETGLEIEGLKFLTAVETLWRGEGKQYVTVFMTAYQKDPGAKAQIMEPEKCEEWVQLPLKEVRQQGGTFKGGLFEPISSLLRQRPEVWIALEQSFEPAVIW